MAVTKDRLIIALKSLYDAVIEENGNLGVHGAKMQNALRLSAAALKAAGAL